MSLFYAALFLVLGIQVPFMPLWLDWKGLTPEQIAFVVAVPSVLRALISPALAVFADQASRHRVFVFALALVGLVSAGLLSQVQGPHLIIGLAIVFTVAKMAMMPLTDTIAVLGLRQSGHDYGRMRLWGSIAFIVVGYGAGLVVSSSNAGAIIWLTLGAVALTVLAAWLLPTVAPGDGQHGDGGTSARSLRTILDGARQLLSHRVFVLFLIAGGCLQASHATFYTFGTIIWQSQGISAPWIAVLWAVGVIAEIILFAYSTSVIARMGLIGVLVLGAVAAVLRWAFMSLDPSFTALLALQILHGLTYGATHLAAMHFLKEAVPQDLMGTAQAVFGSVAVGLAMGLVTLLAGHWFSAFGSASYLAMSGVSLIGLVATLVIAKTWQGTTLMPDAA